MTRVWGWNLVLWPIVGLEVGIGVVGREYWCTGVRGWSIAARNQVAVACIVEVVVASVPLEDWFVRFGASSI